MNNILFCSAGRRCALLKDFKQSMGDSGRLVATDLSIIITTIRKVVRRDGINQAGNATMEPFTGNN